MRFIAIFSVFVLLLQSCYQSEEADLVVHNAAIYSVDENFTTYDAMAIRDGKILELGAERQILNKYKADRKIDARKRAVYPGFYDAHSHFLGFAENMAELNIYETGSIEEIVEKLQAFAEENDREWIVGRGWDQNDWIVKEYPDKAILDSLFPDRPVFLNRVDGHAAWVNSVALEKIGIDENFKIFGGEVKLDKYGDPTGILIDEAAEYMEDRIPPLSRSAQRKLLMEAQELCFKAGLTTVTDAGLPPADILFLDSLQKAGDLDIGIYAMFQPGKSTLEYLKKGPILTDKLSARSVKLYADGALGSRGALLKEPYSDDPGNKGLLLLSDSVYSIYSKACLDYGFQLNTHCIGDSANSHVLKLYAESLKEMNDLRWRIEHAQIVSEEDRQYFKNYGIIPSVQPVHATSDAPWAGKRLGPDRLQNAYSYKSLLNQLGILALGTDFPVERISAIENFYAAVFRKNRFGEPVDGFLPEEALSREEALRGLTIWAALASFEEARKGSLEAGKQADFVILDRDIMKVSEEDILKAEVMDTFIAGEKVNP
jgi:predicted amidohydrolase YtcJ